MTLLHAGPTWLLVLVGTVVVAGLVILGPVGRIVRVFTLLCLALLGEVSGTSISLYLVVSRVGVPHRRLPQRARPRT